MEYALKCPLLCTYTLGTWLLRCYFTVIPEPPVSISSLNFSTHWILIEWELPVQSGNTHVVLQQYSASNETVTVLVNATQTTYNASEEITPYSSYVFYIKVCNEFTCSQFNDGPSTNITTAEDCKYIIYHTTINKNTLNFAFLPQFQLSPEIA